MNRRASGSRGPLFVGTPVLPESFLDRDPGDVLDLMREAAGVNVVMPFSHTHVARQYRPGYAPATDGEGRELTDTWVRTDPKYYEDPALQGKNPDALWADRDLLDEVHAAAEPRGMQVYARILEPYVITGAIPGFERWREVDAGGEPTDHVCFNHPGYIRYRDAVIDDLIHGHPYLAGFKFGQERGGPLLQTLGGQVRGKCFCTHCRKLATKRGLDVDMAREGLKAVHAHGEAVRAGCPPRDGHFVAFLRLLARYPGLLAWEQFWMDSREGQRKRTYRRIKTINPGVQVGWHICHGMTWDLVTRATWDYAAMGPYSDWLSVALYFDSMGRRSMNHFDQNYRDMLFGDAEQNLAYAMYLSLLGYDPQKQPPLSAHRTHDTAFGVDYVEAEIRRVMRAVAGSARVHARIGFDMPGYDCGVGPDQVRAAVQACLDAGVDGFWVGREWDELQPENVRAFGDVLRAHQAGLR